MAFYLLIFEYEQWYAMYVKNCSLKSVKTWNEGAYHPVDGIIYIFWATIFELMYIPFVMVMLKKDVIKNSSYKLMFILGLFDMVALVTDAFLPGVQSLKGEHFCANPMFYYINGAVAMGIYHAVTAICCFLALNRFLTMLFPKVEVMLFEGWRIIIWPFLAVVYMFCFFSFQTPVVFNAHHQKFNFDPFRWTDFEGYPKFYDHPMVFINSGITVFGMGTLYGILCMVLYLKPKNIPTITKLQRVMLLQSLAICGEMFFVAIVYVADSYLVIPEWITRFEHFILICIHGDTPIVYLLLNATLRREVYNNVKSSAKKSLKIGSRTLAEASSFVSKIQNSVHYAPSVYAIDATQEVSEMPRRHSAMV